MQSNRLFDEQCGERSDEIHAASRKPTVLQLPVCVEPAIMIAAASGGCYCDRLAHCGFERAAGERATLL